MTKLIDNHLPEDAIEEIREAKKILEHHGIADRLTELIGAPVTASPKLLPDVVERAFHAAGSAHDGR